MTEQQVAGADGCPRGWVVVIATAHESLALRSITVVPAFADLLALTKDCAAVGIDMPIGLSEGPPRLADQLARRALGRPRSSSVFPPPVRAVLASQSYRDACDVSQPASGRRMSKQAYNLVAKVREVDALMTPALQTRLFEVHPELAFQTLNSGLPLFDSKHTLEGLQQRETLLSAAYALDAATLDLPRGAERDDLYDACAVAWTAARIARHEAVHLPSQPVYDTRGLRMEIVY